MSKIELAGFIINQQKIKQWGSDDIKEITGIILGQNSLELEKQYIKRLKDEMQLYFKIKELGWQYDALKEDRLKTHEQKIEGHIQYVGLIYGKSHAVYLSLREEFYRIKNISTFQKVSWLDVNHYAFLNKKT